MMNNEDNSENEDEMSLKYIFQQSKYQRIAFKDVLILSLIKN